MVTSAILVVGSSSSSAASVGFASSDAGVVKSSVFVPVPLAFVPDPVPSVVAPSASVVSARVPETAKRDWDMKFGMIFIYTADKVVMDVCLCAYVSAHLV